jgi:MFS family permease
MVLSRAWVVALLFGISLFTYIDRWSAAAILNDLQAPPDAAGGSGGGFGLTDTDGGLVTSVFVVTYMLLSPVFGYLGDRMPRIPLLFLGILVWSISTFLSSFSVRFWQFLFFRSLVGVGEASYAVLAPTLIADLYPAGPERTRVLGYYCTSIPLGSALGGTPFASHPLSASSSARSCSSALQNQTAAASTPSREPLPSQLPVRPRGSRQACQMMVSGKAHRAQMAAQAASTAIRTAKAAVTQPRTTKSRP